MTGSLNKANTTAKAPAINRINEMTLSTTGFVRVISDPFPPILVSSREIEFAVSIDHRLDTVRSLDNIGRISP